MRELKRRGDPNVVIALAGNKSDIVAKRKVDAEVADEYAKEHSLIYMDTSAKTAHNVKELFDAIGAWQAVCVAGCGWLAGWLAGVAWLTTTCASPAAARLPKTQPAATNDAFTVMAEPEDTKKGCAC